MDRFISFCNLRYSASYAISQRRALTRNELGVYFGMVRRRNSDNRLRSAEDGSAVAGELYIQPDISAGDTALQDLGKTERKNGGG